MYTKNRLTSTFTLRSLLGNLDFTLLFAVLTLGIISIFAQYSSSGGEFDYHSRSHAIRFFVFFLVFLFISMIQVSFWNRGSTLIYFLILLLLVLVDFFGLNSQGSQRWINLYVINLQPSELMKISIILFLANYYHRVSSSDINKFRYLMYPCIAMLAPFYLVVTQPDLGTATIIVLIGLTVMFVAGVHYIYFLGGILLLPGFLALIFYSRGTSWGGNHSETWF